MATTPTALVTAEQFLEMDLGEGNHELVRGEVKRLSPGHFDHGIVTTNIARIVGNSGKQ